jgi:uncharacterized membrane protein YfcA
MAVALTSRRQYGRLGAIGLAGGLFSGLLGVGGGVVMVPLLVLWGGFGQRDAHAVSLGAIAGAQAGARLLARADERKLKLAFGLFLLVVAVLMAVGR